MQLDVKNLTFGAVGGTEEVDLVMPKWKISDGLIAKDLQGKIRLTRLDESILVQVNGGANILLECDRCLAEFDRPIPFKFSEEYFLGGFRENEEGLLVGRNFEIDIEQPIREEIILSIPVQKLCRHDCKGLCSHCGADRNNKNCDCEPKVNKVIKFVK